MGSEREDLRANVLALIEHAKEGRGGEYSSETATDAILSLLSPELGGPKLREVGVHAAVNAYNRAMAEGSPGNVEFLTDQYVAMQVALEAYGEAPELGGWRRMDRAPDTTVAPWDGNDVLLRCGWDDMHVCIVAAYDPEIPSAPWVTLDGPSYLPSWPTEWMPLPPPPTGAR